MALASSGRLLYVNNFHLFWQVMEGSGRAPQVSGRLWLVLDGFGKLWGRFWTVLGVWEALEGRALDGVGRGPGSSSGADLEGSGRF